MSQDAVARGLDRSLDTQRRWEYLRRGFFAQEWLRWNRDRLTVSPEEVEQYYEQNQAGFRIPARLKLRQLVVASEEQAKRALAQLLDGTADFSNLAQQISLGSSAAQGGGLAAGGVRGDGKKYICVGSRGGEGGVLATWVMRENEKMYLYGSETDAAAAGVTSLDPILEAAAFAIDQVNGLSGIVKGADNRYHLFQLAERQEEHQQDKTEVWDQIKNFLTVQKLQASIDELQKKAAIERFTDRMEGVTQSWRSGSFRFYF